MSRTPADLAARLASAPSIAVFVRDTRMAYRARVALPTGLHRAVHAGLGWLLAGLSIVLLLPSPTFNNPNFRFFLYLMPEEGWALFYALCACVAFVGLRTRSWLVRFLAACIVGTAHWATALMFLLGNHASSGTVAYSFPAFLSWYLAWSYRHAPR